MTALQFTRQDGSDVWADITDEVAAQVPPCFSGACHAAVTHTTVGLFLYEGKDPASKEDLFEYLERLVPNEPWFKHARKLPQEKHDSNAHIKTALLGQSVTIPCQEGELLLGKWQRVYLCDFKVGRARTVRITLLPDMAAAESERQTT